MDADALLRPDAADQSMTIRDFQGRWSLLSSLRLVNTNTLREMDGEAFRLGEKSLDLRTAALMSDDGFHLMTVDSLEFTPSDLDDMDISDLFSPIEDGNDRYGHLRLRVKAFVNPGFCEPHQVIVDHLSVSFHAWLQRSADEFSAAMSYLLWVAKPSAGGTSFQMPNVPGHLMEIKINPERAKSPEQKEALENLLRELSRNQTGGETDSALVDRLEAELGDFEVPMLIQTGDLVDWTSFKVDLGQITTIDGKMIQLYEPGQANA